MRKQSGNVPILQVISSDIVLAEFQPGDLIAMDFIGTIGQSKKAGRGVGCGKTEIVAGSAAAMGLDRPVDHLAGHVWDGNLDHCNLRLRSSVPNCVHHVRRIESEQAGLFDHDPRFRDTLLRYGLFGNRLAEGHPTFRPDAHLFKRPFHKPDQAHAVMNPSRT